MQNIVDLSHPLGPQTAVFPGDPPTEIRILDSATESTDDGQRHLNCSQVTASLHCGTHMDAPYHFFSNARTIDQVSLEHCIGQSLLVRLDFESCPSIELKHLLPYKSRLQDTQRIVFNTSWYHRWGSQGYFTDHPVITGPAAQFLVDCGVVLVGVDTPSVDRDPYAAHLTLLGNDVLIIENLSNLDSIVGDEFRLIATPLAIPGRDGSPVRAVAMQSAARGESGDEQ